MNGLWTIPISSVISLSPDQAVTISRAILRSECSYSKLSPSVLTISDKLMTPDGGIDAEVCVPNGLKVQSDCIFQTGITGFQIKSGTTFQPWVFSSIRDELLNSKGDLKARPGMEVGLEICQYPVCGNLLVLKVCRRLINAISLESIRDPNCSLCHSAITSIKEKIKLTIRGRSGCAW